MPRVQLSGGAYQARSVIASAQRSLNLYPEPMPQVQGEPAQFAHYPTPGLRLLGTMPQGNIRGIRQATTGGIYVVAGNGVYSVNPTTWAGTLIGSLTSLRPYPVSMADNGNTLVIVDGTASGWTVDLPSNAFAAISDPAFYGADRVDYLDTYLLFNKPNTPQFYSSDSLATTFDSLYFANKESHSDLLVTLAVAKREIWLIGERTTEIWYNSGGQSGDFPFEEIQGTFVDHGCRAKYSVATYDDAVYWLGYDRAGQGIVYKGAGYQVSRISTYAIETELARYSTISDAIGFVYSLGGHACYVLTFPTADHTWVYDITTQQWHEWLWIDINGTEHRHRANCCYLCNGTVVVGDWQSGNLYALDQTVFDDNGSPIKRQRSYPHTINDAKRVYYREFVADLETGNTNAVAQTTTTITQIVTWLPEIAAFVGPTTGTTALTAVDWQRNVVYFLDVHGYSSWSTTLVSQNAPVAAAAIAQSPSVLAVDPVSGDLLVQPNVANGSPVLKLNPTTFATISSFGGVAGAFPSYPGSVWVGQAIVCVVCNGFSYGFLKESELSGGVAAFRVDTMVQAGFYATVVSGSYDARGNMCAGASGGATATVFLSWDNETPPSATVPLYVITVTAGAETYNPASWPTTNPHITWATVGTVHAAAVDPTWSHLAVQSLGCDLADGNALMWVSTGDAVAQQNYVIKVNAASAAVMWAVAVSSTTRMNLQNSRINGSLWVFDSGTSQRINTATGQIDQRIFTGTTNSLPGYPMTDSQQSLALYYGNYTGGTNAPVPVTGTGTGTAWFIMGGQTNVTNVIQATLADNRIWLDWSDDRGHSYGNPVSQNIGHRGAYLTSLQWQRLGMSRDRVFRITFSSPLATALQGAWIEILGVGST